MWRNFELTPGYKPVMRRYLMRIAASVLALVAIIAIGMIAVGLLDGASTPYWSEHNDFGRLNKQIFK